MKQKRSRLRLLVLCPLLFGMIGFLSAGGVSVPDALYRCVQMYVLNYSSSPENVWLEIARWTAPLATAGSILMLISSLNQYVRAGIKTMVSDSVAVYGPEADVSRILSQLGRRGIRGGDRLLPARNYILLYPQEDSFAFYDAHRDAMRGAQVFLRCDTLPAQSVSPVCVHLFQPMEIAARLFWKEGALLPVSEEKGGKLNIALIGFGKAGEELLYWGLQYNVFSPGQEIRYHVFGDTAAFLRAHPMLDQIGDPVLSYDDGWQNHTALLQDADLILVPPQTDGAQETIVNELLSLVPEKELTVFTDRPSVLAMLDGQSRLRIIDIPEQTLQAEQILKSELIRNAMRVNMRYVHLYTGKDESETQMRDEWERLSPFLRYSNISTADYHEIRQRMLRRMGAAPDGSDLTQEQRELLAELEHMRWCRYHWLNNWRYGKPANGGAKDEAARIHIDLIPYRELSEPEKDKDRTTIDTLLQL